MCLHTVLQVSTPRHPQTPGVCTRTRPTHRHPNIYKPDIQRPQLTPRPTHGTLMDMPTAQLTHRTNPTHLITDEHPEIHADTPTDTETPPASAPTPHSRCSLSDSRWMQMLCRVRVRQRSEGPVWNIHQPLWGKAAAHPAGGEPNSDPTLFSSKSMYFAIILLGI